MSDTISKVFKFESNNITYSDIMGDSFSKNKKLYIDLLPIDYVSESNLVRSLKGMLITFLDISYGSLRCYKKYSPHLAIMAKESRELGINLLIRRIIAFPALILGPNNTLRFIHHILKNEKKSKLVTIANGVKGYQGEIVPFETFGNGTELDFEGYLFNAPIDYHHYLTNRYGEYMTPPNIDERTERHVRLRDDWDKFL